LAEIGTILGGRYQLVELLGQGGMATIFRALDTQLGRDVAVKLLRPEYLRDPDFSSRFRQEAQAAASLTHPNVVTVFDYGEDPSGPYIVMELIDGEDLATIIRRSGALPPRQATRIAAAVARALAAAHARGLVHRDVKPGNVLIGRDGQVKVVDFGIARAVSEAQVTLPGTTLGSVHYFSPEQARGEPATESSDIYSLGIVLYELLTGARPWEGDSAAAVGLARLSGPAPDPMAVRPSVPPDLAAITRKALAPEPRDRFASAAAMADALDAALTTGGASAAASAAAAGAMGAAATAAMSGVARPNPAGVPYAADAYADSNVTDEGTPAPSTASPPEEEEKTRAIVWVAGIVAIMLLIAIAFLVFQLAGGGGSANPSASPSASPSPSAGVVTVPNFVGSTLVDANAAAEALGIKLVPTGEPSDQPVGTILAQDVLVGTSLPVGSEVNVTVASGADTTPVPTITDLKENAALQAIVEAGLAVGSKTEEFDANVPKGSVVSQNPRAGTVVAKGTPIDYVLSKGPEPTPTPTPPPTPTPTPPPTPTPTPPPTPTPTPSETPAP
jgi:serine/threonine-protein kinase